METPFLFVEILPYGRAVSGLFFFVPTPHRHFTEIDLWRMSFAPPRYGILTLPGRKNRAGA